ncbi:MAG: hypothetical protein IKF51_08460 [Solobacterium sp.]|nr:hypothetical protein [Solobacterium sp.]
MELIDLLGDLHLDRVKDSTLQKAAQGLAFELVLDPLAAELHTGLMLDEQERSRLAEQIRTFLIRAFRIVVEGSLPSKMKAALSVKKKADRNYGLLPAEAVEINIQSLIEDAAKMHIHHMSDEDYRILADHIVQILLYTGTIASLFEWHTILSEETLRSFRTDVIYKMYTGLKIAFGHQDDLIQRAEESKQRAQNH